MADIMLVNYQIILLTLYVQIKNHSGFITLRQQVFINHYSTNIADQLIRTYFSRGYMYKEIRFVLQSKHNFTISLVQLQRLISKLGLFRRGHHSPVDDVVKFIDEEVKRSGQLHQYCNRQFIHPLPNL